MPLTFTCPSAAVSDVYMVSHLLVHLGWVDFDLGVPPSCQAAQPLLPNSLQPTQNLADNPTQVHE